jgi:hypothetical protein
MDPGALIPIVMFALFIGGTLVVVLLGRGAGFKRNAGLREMAARLGLEYSETQGLFKFMPPKPEVRGIVHGRRARIYEFSRGAGKSRTHWVAASVQCNGSSPLQLSLRTQGSAHYEKLAGAFGYKDIVIGDHPFDSVFAIHGNDETFIQTALIPEIRHKLISFWPRARSGRIRIENSEVTYEEQGSLSRERPRENVERALAVLPDLAALAEVRAAATQ